MIVYLASPKSGAHAEGMRGCDVLLSYSEWGPYLESYIPSFGKILIDSGAFKEFTTGKKVELSAYKEWALGWLTRAQAVAGLDDLSGDWKRSLANYEAFPEGFPTYHITDPPELLADLVSLAQQRKQWLGLGMSGRQKQRERAKHTWLTETLERIPPGIHVHGWALGAYADHRRLDSIDSTRWLGVMQDLGNHHITRYLTPGERVQVASVYLSRRARDRQQGAKGPAFRREKHPELFGEEEDER